MRLSDSRSFSWIEGWIGVADDDELGEERLLRADLRRVKIYWLVNWVNCGYTARKK